MVKTLLFSLIIGLSFSSLAMTKKKQLQLIETCKIIAQKQGVFAGANLPVYLSFTLANGDIVSLGKGAKFNFKDFNISVTGSGNRARSGRKKLTLSAAYNAINDPFIRVSIQMIKRPEIRYDVAIPIHFKGSYTVSFNGYGGSSGDTGTHGRDGQDGCGKLHNGDGESGQDGDNGYNGERGRNGYNGHNVNVYVSLVNFEKNNSELIKIESYYPGGSVITRYLERSGQITINAVGGRGGDGGDGGNGGDGGDGDDGLFERPATKTDKGCTAEGYGGNGGEGGNGGVGGIGGVGGDGGNVSLYFAQDAWFFKNNIQINNFGARGGTGGKAGNAGCEGEYGKGGRGCGDSGTNGYRGERGRMGQNGSQGRIKYYDWN